MHCLSQVGWELFGLEIGMYFSSVALISMINDSHCHLFKHCSYMFIFKKKGISHVSLLISLSINLIWKQLLFGDWTAEIWFSCGWFGTEKFVASSGCHFVLFFEGMLIIFMVQFILLKVMKFCTGIGMCVTIFIWFFVRNCSQCPCSYSQIRLGLTCWKQLLWLYKTSLWIKYLMSLAARHCLQISPS